jgi:hypothetical protein
MAKKWQKKRPNMDKIGKIAKTDKN